VFQVLLADGTVVPLTAAAKKKIMAAVDALAAKALRCLALAQKTDLGELATYDGDSSHPVRHIVCPATGVKHAFFLC
jgi:magnesium-transporting ATPase (P-type)